MGIHVESANVETIDRVAHEVQSSVTSSFDPIALPEIVIKPSERWQLINIRELWRYRELIGILTWRDVKVRYKQTLLGAAWAILQPVMMMVIFTIVFSRVAGVPSGHIPYPLFAYAGLLPWTFFVTAVASAGNSVVGSEKLITKIYFPRLAIPFAAVGAAVVDLIIASGLLAVMMLYYGISPGFGVLLVPIIFLPIALLALGVGTLLAALNVSYRDFRYVIPFLLQLWMFATPTVYMQVSTRPPEVAVAPGQSAITSANATTHPAETRGTRLEGSAIRTGLALNPMITLVSAFRTATLGGPILWGPLGAASVGSALALLVGCLYFRKVEDRLADVI